MTPARQIRELADGLRTAFGGSNATGRVRDFDGWTGRASREGDADGGYDHTRTVQEYYDLCTELMVWGWGESLHFAPLSQGESLEDSKIRHQRLMMSKLELRPGMAVVDIGCGIGGPMRRVAREARVGVVGVNASEVQCNKARDLNEAAGIASMTECLQCSFMDMSVIADQTFDRGYAIESTCHADDKVAAFAEIHRVLKPGALLWGQEMCMTDLYDPGSNRHRAIERELRRGIALKDIATFGEVNRALEAAGFEVLEGADLAVHQGSAEAPWYQPMETPRGLPGGLRRTPMGRKALRWGLRIAELLGAFPKGSAEVVALLDRTANAYVAGGKTGIFTPLYCFVARRPVD
ncbi:MAG: methyltransferase domain-containing protein [Acidobacteria bacterium]|nr:methyltransferase domain-containing protein [Acidobacteriota bacterium]MYE42503.1 methyltransferase domain-containing protein [Acidobacteriota bacterium]